MAWKRGHHLPIVKHYKNSVIVFVSTYEYTVGHANHSLYLAKYPAFVFA